MSGATSIPPGVEVRVEGNGVVLKLDDAGVRLLASAPEMLEALKLLEREECSTKENDEGEKYTVLNQRSKSALGKMFAAKYGGRKFRLKDGRLVQFGKRGRNRHRKYSVEIID